MHAFIGNNQKTVNIQGGSNMTGTKLWLVYRQIVPVIFEPPCISQRFYPPFFLANFVSFLLPLSLLITPCNIWTNYLSFHISACIYIHRWKTPKRGRVWRWILVQRPQQKYWKCISHTWIKIGCSVILFHFVSTSLPFLIFSALISSHSSAPHSCHFSTNVTHSFECHATNAEKVSFAFHDSLNSHPKW